MRILHAIPVMVKAAGTAVYCAELSGHLANLGTDNEIVLPAPPTADCCWTPPEVSVGTFSAAATRCPDIIHVHGLWAPFLHRVADWGRRRDVPVVFSPQGMLTPWSLNHKRWKKSLALAAYQWRDLSAASLIHATADAEVEDIRRLGLRQPLVVSPFGIALPPERTAPGTAPRAAGRDRMALFISRIHPKKGLLALVEAWARLNREAPAGRPADRWHLVIAGPDEGDHEAEVKARAAAVGLSVETAPAGTAAAVEPTADVTFVGPVYDLEKTELYGRADVFVLPSHSENFGVVVLEALACGLPVITTKATPWRELAGVGRPAPPPGVSDRAGWWIDVGVEPLVEALRDVRRADDAELARIRDNARWLACERYSWPAAARSMKQAYEWLLHGGAAPPCIRL